MDMTAEELAALLGQNSTITPKMARETLPKEGSIGFWDWLTNNDQYVTGTGQVMEYNLLTNDHNVGNFGDAKTVGADIGSMDLGKKGLSMTQYDKLNTPIGAGFMDYLNAGATMYDMYAKNAQLGIEGDKMKLARDQFSQATSEYDDEKAYRDAELARRDIMSQNMQNGLASSGIGAMYAKRQ